MKIVATAFSLLLMCSVDTAHAAPVTFEVEYTTLFNQYCFYHSGICVPRSLDSFTRTFTLDSAQLLVDGVYDVAASLDPAPTVTPPPAGTVTISLAAFAKVTNEHVIDMVTTFQGEIEDVCFGFPKLTNSSFTASSGSWESATSVTSVSGDFCNGFSTAANGTYTVQQMPVEVPEPGSLLLVLGGGILAGRRKRYRVH
jgi:hypothetical protein